MNKLSVALGLTALTAVPSPCAQADVAGKKAHEEHEEEVNALIASFKNRGKCITSGTGGLRNPYPPEPGCEVCERVDRSFEASLFGMEYGLGIDCLMTGFRALALQAQHASACGGKEFIAESRESQNARMQTAIAKCAEFSSTIK